MIHGNSNMKSLQLLRIFLQLFVVSVFQFFYLEQLVMSLLAITSANALFLLVLIWLSFLGKFKLSNSTFTHIIDIGFSISYLIFMNPFWLLAFIAIQAVSILYLEKKYYKILVILLSALSVLIILIRYYMNNSITSIFLIIPSFIVIGIFLRVLWQKNINRIKEYNYLKTLVDNKNKLLSTLTHELRTPLAVIKTSNELVLEERPGPLNETQKSLLSSSLENTVRLTSLVENILSRIKVEFAWFSMKKKVLDVRPLIRKVALDIRPFMETKKQTLHYNYPGLLSKTQADDRWIQQVLLNLIHNGSKNSPPGAKLQISVKENEQCIVISVHDDGKGIVNKEISYVFNEFYQSGDPSKNLNDGAGLGLTIVKDIIEKHGGNVYISSQPDHGTTVSFTLPVYKGVLSETFGFNN